MARLHDPSAACVDSILRQELLLHIGGQAGVPELGRCHETGRRLPQRRGEPGVVFWGIGVEMNGYDSG